MEETAAGQSGPADAAGPAGSLAAVAQASGVVRGGRDARDVLRERALSLAQVPDERAQTGGTVEILEFTLGRERYAFLSGMVREVFPLTEITPLPGMPSYVLGVVNVRGRILSVIDIRRLFQFEGTGLTNLNKAIILHTDDMEFGVLADQVAGVYPIDTVDLQATLPTLTGPREEYLKGITPDQVVVLDAERMLRDDRLIVRDEA